MMPLAFALADRVGGLWASDAFQQKTMGMEPEEFREFLAVRLAEVLTGFRPSKGPPPPAVLAVDPEPTSGSHITHAAAVGLLETAPEEVRAAYRECRKNGDDPAAALAVAMELLKRMRERAYESQLTY